MDPNREKEQRQTQDYLETQCGELKEINLTWGRGEAEKIAKNREEWKEIVQAALCPTTRDEED